VTRVYCDKTYEADVTQFSLKSSKMPTLLPEKSDNKTQRWIQHSDIIVSSRASDYNCILNKTIILHVGTLSTSTGKQCDT